MHRLRKRLVEADLEERLHMPGLDPRRADLSVAGSVLLDTILRRLGADDITLCDLALREGLVLDYIHRNSARRSARSSAIRTCGAAASSSWASGAATGRSTRSRSRGSRSASSIRRAACTASAIASASGSSTRALLHDVGVHISYERHHRHSYYLIKNGDLRGFEPQEIEIIALVARYHRQATPKKSHEGYGDLNGERCARRSERCCRRCVRLAEGLDRSHAQASRRSISYRAATTTSLRLRDDRRRRAGAVGRAPPRRAAGARCSASRFASKSAAPDRPTRRTRVAC